MRKQTELRAIASAEALIKGGTVRSVAKEVGASKSTVHKDIAERVEQVDPVLARQAKAILAENKEDRHNRGGAATKAKYASR